MIRVDHVLHGVKDLDQATRDFGEKLGLNAVVGGVHPGRGTHNSLVHLASAYIELISVAEPTSARAQTLLGFLEGGDGPFDFALSTSDIAAASTFLKARGVTVGETREGGRRTPAGATLSWSAATTSVGPFMIEWGDHPDWFADRVELARHHVPWGTVHALLIAAADPRKAADEYVRQLGCELHGTLSADLVSLRMPGADGVNASLGPAPLLAILRPSDRPGAAGEVLDAALRAKLERGGDGFVGLAVHTSDLDQAVTGLRARGTRVEQQAGWAVVDPADAHGLLLELVG